MTRYCCGNGINISTMMWSIFYDLPKNLNFRELLKKHEVSLRFLKFMLRENKVMKKSIGKEQMFRIPYTFFHIRVIIFSDFKYAKSIRI